MSAERERLLEVPRGRAPWRHWGPYLSERAWGTVREDYSRSGTPWDYFTHDQARSRVYRWSEDGLAGICDDRQTLCFALAFWNGRDPILKERIFGLTGPEGNHGEDAKEYWFYLDSTPTHSWMRWRYTADYAKADPEDVLVRLMVRNAGPERATIDVLPTLWFRNTWAWGADFRRPSIKVTDGGLRAEHQDLGPRILTLGGAPELLFCENETNAQRLRGVRGLTPYPKDGINDHVVAGAATVNPAGHGTKAAAWYHLTVASGATAELRLRLAPARRDLAEQFERMLGR